MNKASLLFVLTSVLLSCGTSRNMAVGPAANAITVSSDQAPEGQRKLLYSAYLELVVEEPDTAVRQVLRLTEAYAGTIVTTDNRRAIIRVPAEELDRALADVAALGKVENQRLEGTDVTDEYQDYGIRLDNAERSRQRYLELLAKAATVAETLLVERELERLNETIDMLKGKRKRLDQLEAYATVTVTFTRKVKPGPLGYVFRGLFRGVRWLFVRN